MILDGGTYTVLYRIRAGSGIARKYTYANPCHYQREDAVMLCRTINLVKEEFGLEAF